MDEAESDMVLLSATQRDQLQSVETISYLQQNLAPYESWIVYISVLGDNREMFTFFFPLLAGLANELGARLLWSAVLVEWSNLLLKWWLKGDRPYWWIGETMLYNDETRPLLKQFSNSCEAGPGTPSGHIMMNVAVFYIIVRGFSALTWKSGKFNVCQKVLVSGFLYIAYVLWIAGVFISRLYIQAHFIHQCVLGAVVGLIIGQFCYQSKFLLKLNKVGAISMSCFIVSSAIGLYLFLISSGMDPLWSVPLALQYCSKSEYVKIDTQPFYLVMRMTGAALGLGLGIASEQRELVLKSTPTFIRSLLTIKGGVFIGKMATFIQANLPKEDYMLYMTLSLGLNTVLPLIIISLLPHFLLSLGM